MPKPPTGLYLGLGSTSTESEEKVSPRLSSVKGESNAGCQSMAM